MKNKYDFNKIESKWKDKWYASDAFNAVDFDKRQKKYVLCEFPYPSGSGLHIGHAFSFTSGDVYARFQRYLGYNTMFPMGWDAFGLPTENYAIKVKKKPQDITKESTDNFRQEMKSLGFSIDWNREVNTTDPNYYKWTQWIFLKLFEKGLAFKEERPINWCPSCKTGLADEETVNGNCERCGTPTEKRNISQWIVKITDYADRLISGLENTNFIQKVKSAQINWIDRKEWIDITYQIEGIEDTVTVATTRPDTNFGATFVVIAPEHQIASKIISGKIKTDGDLEQIKKYVKEALNKSELERQKEVSNTVKTGVFTGLYAINQLTGRKMPLYITDFVLGSVGTGAVVGVPGHDMRDFDFAKTFNIDILRVVVGIDGDRSEISKKEQVQEEEGIMINSGFLDGMDIHEATQKVMDYMVEKGWGKKTVRYHLRDWIFSRQHYWGEPIPMIHCEKCGWVPVPEKDLPVVLPEVEKYEPTDTGQSPLADIKEWVNVKCPKCFGEAKRETDTMPNWGGSDWYYLRYADPNNPNKMADVSKSNYWLPVDVYIGGDEHNTLHLLYSRFIFQFLYDLGEVEMPEPYDKRLSHGVILGPDNKRMSKTRGNVIVPGEVREKVGADATRTYLMFIGPFDATMAWNESGVHGVYRFLNRVYSYIVENAKSFSKKDNSEISKSINSIVKFATSSLEQFQFNTTIAKYMEFINLLERTSPSEVSKSTIEKFLIMLSVFAPFISEELWEVIGNKYTIMNQKWPSVDESTLVEHTVELPVQIDGKMRGKVIVNPTDEESFVKKAVIENASLSKYFDGKVIKKFIYVPGKIVNIVL